MLFSFIIPVYNRPDEIQDLLTCFTQQTEKNFEVIIVESGSEIKSDEVVSSFKTSLDISYHLRGNHGQGFSRNYGMSQAKGAYFCILDSDVLIDNNYVENLSRNLRNHYLDCYGGPDKLHPASTDMQKAVNYCMTSIFTTGGIRGGKKHVGKFFPRSFNMGFSRAVYDATQGFEIPFFGEDIILSARIMEKGFTTGLYEDVYVYHKRKTNYRDFFKQMNFFGRARINIYKFFPKTLKLVHFFPAAFFIFLCCIPLSFFINTTLGLGLLILLAIYLLIIFADATIQNKSLYIGIISMGGVLVQMTGYGTGFIKDFIKRVIFRQE